MLKAHQIHKILTNDERPGDYKDGDLYEYKHIRLDYKVEVSLKKFTSSILMG